ncbi:MULTISPECIES: HNH endonuclease signature motif containing protein [Legionella]|nr:MULTISPECIES: HNH endonuclease signature motif containing protein [Legionella]PJE05552.1 MAG: HNH endonuclease [Legionella sp.]
MVKLVDFFNFAPLNKLRHSMVAELVQEFKFDTGISLLEDDFIKMLDGDGIEIESLEEIDFRGDKTLGYKGQRVLIYIRDVHSFREEIRMPKFHISTCDTLVTMWKKRRSERYVLYRKENGIFPVNIFKAGKADIRHEKLNVCRNCLTNLNWNNYTQKRHARDSLVSEFSIAKFFEIFPKSLLSVKPTYDADNAPLNDYTANWNEISKDAKRKAGYRCENTICRIDLTGRHSQYLHVHHIDGQRNNNKKHNLKVLCVKCHAHEPDHGHMKSGQDYKKFVAMYEDLKEQNY